MTEARSTDNVFLKIQPNFRLHCMPLASKWPKISRHTLRTHILCHWFTGTEPTVRYWGNMFPSFIICFMTAAFLELNCTQTGSYVLSSFLSFFFHHSLKLSFFPTAPFTSLILLILHNLLSSFFVLSFTSFFLTPSLSLSIPSFLTICSQSGSVRSWKDLCPLASARQCPVGVIMMDGVISRGAFRQEGWAHHAFSQL